MIANYTNHAANERTFLAWIRTGLAVAAFGFFLIKLNVLVDAVGRGSIRHLPAEDASAVVAVATRYAGLAMVAIGIAIIARSSFAFERTRRAIDRDRAVRLLIDLELLLHQQRADRLASRVLAVWRHRRRHDLLGDATAFRRDRGHLDFARLASSAHQNLGFDHPVRRMLLDERGHAVRRRRVMALRNGDSRSPEELLALVLHQVHRGARGSPTPARRLFCTFESHTR